MIDLIKRARLLLGFLSSEDVMDRLVRCGHDPVNVFFAVRGAEVLVTAELLDEPFEPTPTRRLGDVLAHLNER